MGSKGSVIAVLRGSDLQIIGFADDIALHDSRSTALTSPARCYTLDKAADFCTDIIHSGIGECAWEGLQTLRDFSFLSSGQWLCRVGRVHLVDKNSEIRGVVLCMYHLLYFPRQQAPGRLLPHLLFPIQESEMRKLCQKDTD